MGSLVALAGGLVLLAVAGGLAYASSNWVRHGPDVTGIQPTPLGWAMIGLAGVAVLVLAAAAITQLVAWVGAVINTAQLEDKTWFIVLVVTGLLSFGFIAMIVYLIAGPEDAQPITATPAITTVATRGPAQPKRIAAAHTPPALRPAHRRRKLGQELSQMHGPGRIALPAFGDAWLCVCRRCPRWTMGHISW